jgi:hypothetical protein
MSKIDTTSFFYIFSFHLPAQIDFESLIFENVKSFLTDFFYTKFKFLSYLFFYLKKSFYLYSVTLYTDKSTIIF